MTLAALIRKRESGKPATAIPATAATETVDEPLSVARIATVAVANRRDDETNAPRPDAAAEVRRQRLLAMLAVRPGIRYAVLTDTEAEPDAVILALAIRGKATCELRIPPDRYAPFLLLELLDKHGATLR